MCDANHYYFIFVIICDFLFMFSLGGRNHFVLVTTPVLHAASKGVVTLVPGALTLLYLVNTVLVSIFDLEINTAVKRNISALSVVLRRNKPELTDQLAQVAYLPVSPRALV